MPPCQRLPLCAPTAGIMAGRLSGRPTTGKGSTSSTWTLSTCTPRVAVTLLCLYSAAPQLIRTPALRSCGAHLVRADLGIVTSYRSMKCAADVPDLALSLSLSLSLPLSHTHTHTHTHARALSPSHLSFPNDSFVLELLGVADRPRDLPTSRWCVSGAPRRRAPTMG